MALFNKPDEKVFASNAKQGEVNDFPDVPRGWGLSFDQTGGIPPMEWFNWLFKRADERHGYLMQRGLPEWSATLDYPEAAYVQYNGLSYKSLKANKGKLPDEDDSLYWVRWGDSMNIKKGSINQSGIVQLSSSVISNSEEYAATSKAIKTVRDEAVLKSGDTMTGTLTVPNVVINDPSNNNNSLQIGDDVRFVDVDNLNTVGFRGMQDPNVGFIAYGSANKRFGFDGYRFRADSAIYASQYGHGGYNIQYNSKAPFMVEEDGSQSRDTYHPFIKGRVRKQGEYGAALSFGYTTRQEQGDGTGRGVIHLAEDSGINYIWSFEHGGNFRSQGDVISGNGRGLNSALMEHIFYNFRNKFQMAEYSGQGAVSRVFRIPITDNRGIKIYVAEVSLGPNLGGTTLNLAEALQGFKVGVATSAVGGQKKAYAVEFNGDNRVNIYTDPVIATQKISLILIGEYFY
jgi:probable tail fiber protein (fragment)|nr:MAG TPA: Baseplate structural protein [Caudoviricetes sp.]